jgi:hypothetical protein
MKPWKVAIRDTFVARKGEGDTRFCPSEILLVIFADNEAATRTAVEAAGPCLHRAPCAAGMVLGGLAAHRDDIRALHPRTVGPKASKSPVRASEFPRRDDSCRLAVRQSLCFESEEAEVPVRRSSIILAGIGVVLIVLGVLVRFVVVPVATKLPGSTNLGITYSGRATLLNSSALQPATPRTSSRPTSR